MLGKCSVTGILAAPFVGLTRHAAEYRRHLSPPLYLSAQLRDEVLSHTATQLISYIPHGPYKSYYNVLSQKRRRT